MKRSWKSSFVNLSAKSYGYPYLPAVFQYLMFFCRIILNFIMAVLIYSLA